MEPLMILAIGLFGISGAAFALHFSGITIKRTAKKKPKEEKPVIQETEIAIDKAPQRLDFEIVREKDDSVVIIRRGKIKKTEELLYWKRIKPHPRAYFVNHIIKREIQTKGFLGRVKKRISYLVRWNAYWSEALDAQHQQIPVYSEELANLLLADDVIQMRNGVAKIQSMIFDGTMLKLMIVIYFVAIPFGLLMDGVLGLVPSLVIRWIP